jgi:predicted nucleotidyltransferase component of viral defense system
MITADHIGRIASNQNVDPGIVEKDYILSKVLTVLAHTTEVQESLVFKGGTALKKFFYSTWRYSEDLDFTATRAMTREAIQTMFKRATDAITEQYGLSMRVIEYSQYPKEGNEIVSAQLKLGYDGPLRRSSGLKNNVRVDIAFVEAIVDKPEARQMLLAYPDDVETRMLVYTLEEIVAEKMRSILQRGKSRDYYDVWLLLKDFAKDFNPERTRDILHEKCAFKQMPKAQANDFFDPKRIVEAKSFWQRGLAHQMESLPGFEQVIDALRRDIGSILRE